MQTNKNEYNQTEFEKEFTNTELYQKLAKDFDVIDFSKNWKHGMVTPREHWGKKRPTIFTGNIFYYLNWLLEKNPKRIIDLGCGWNIFPKYIPTVIGIGGELPNHPHYHAHMHGCFNEEFVGKYTNSFESIFSICALHFTPLSQFKNVLINFYKTIAPGGRGFLAMNLQRMLDKEISEIKNYSLEKQENYVRACISETNIDFLVVDIDFEVRDEHMNGNIRLVMEKPLNETA